MGDSSVAAAAARAAGGTGQVAGYSFDLVRQFTRPPDAFTQGLAFHRGRLFEGTGLYGESRLRETVLQDGVQKVLRSRLLPDGIARSQAQKDFQRDRLAAYGSGDRPRTGSQLFGEGIALAEGRIYQLTWVEGVCLVWDIANWNAPARVFEYEGEGWGLTYDAQLLIMSDGSARLQFRRPDTFALVRTVQVIDPRRGAPVGQLNELEFIDGKVFANVYGTRYLAKIDPHSGRLEGYVFLDGRLDQARQAPLLPPAAWDLLDARWDVLNGIAYDPDSRHLFVTGKRWTSVFEIALRKVADAL
jgi:glutamine cyclotransferase